MPRVHLLRSLAVLALASCSAPALKDFSSGPNDDPSTGSSSTTGGTSSTSTDASIGSVSSISESGSDSGSTSTGVASTTDDSSSGTTTGPDTSSGDAPPVCGDGVVEGEEECDDDTGRCADDCTKNRWVFATAATDHNGDLGGIEAIDGRCKQYALQSGRADDSWKSFIAWVSDADHDVRDRLYPGKGRYVRTDGTVVVEHVEAFFSGTLAAPINVDEFGQPAPGGVLTGTLPDGTAAPGTHCENWTSGSLLDSSLYTGHADATDDWWTMGQNPDTNPTTCAGQAWRLYCIEGA